MFTIIDINKIKQETCENEFNSESITTENCTVDNPNEDETKHRQKPEVVGEILVKESNEINIFDNIKDNKAQEENVIKEEVVPKILDDEIKYEFVDTIVKEESQDNNYEFINVKSELHDDEFLNGTDNIEGSTSKISPKSTDDPKLFKCDICDKIFNKRYNFEVHKRVHTGEKPFKCDLCDKTFNQTCNLVSHKRCHTGEKPFKCDVCDKAFNQTTSLVVHKRLHTGEKPFKCDVCGKTFRMRNNLTAHKRCHTGEKPYKCDVCDKTFSQKSNLVTHKNNHTGERPYECDICHKTFSHRCSLAIHQRYHTGEKPYKCDVCDKTFSQKNNLVRHKNNHTGE